MNIDWQDINYFLTVAECGSLSEAARTLTLSQPTLSRRIESLETGLGLRLFKRHSKGLDLTHEGTLLLEQARQMMVSAKNIERLAGGEVMQPEGTVRVSVPEGLCNDVILPALGEFRQRYPALRLLLAVTPRSANLIRGEADMAVRLYRPKEPDLIVRKLGDMTMGLYASSEYLTRHAKPQGVADLSAHEGIGYGDELENLAENLWLLAHCPPSRVGLRSDSTSCRLQATLNGLGISIQPVMIATQHPGLVRLLQDVAIPGHEIWLTYHKDLARSYRTRIVAEMLSEAVAGGGQ